MPHTSIRPLYDLIRLNSILMIEAIDQFDEDTAKERILGGSKNSFKFLLGHMTWVRCMMSNSLGEPQSFPWADKFGGGQAHTDGSDYPKLSELAAAYKEVADFLETKLANLSEEDFMKPAENIPGEQEQTVRGAISFWVWQDCYHTGQTGSILTTVGLADLKTLYYNRKDRLQANP